MLAVHSNKLLRQIRSSELKCGGSQLPTAPDLLKTQVASVADYKLSYPEPLVALFDFAYPEEWHKYMSEMLDTLIYAMGMDENYCYSNALCYVRRLEVFFSAFPAMGKPTEVS